MIIHANWDEMAASITTTWKLSSARLSCLLLSFSPVNRLNKKKEKWNVHENERERILQTLYKLWTSRSHRVVVEDGRDRKDREWLRLNLHFSMWIFLFVDRKFCCWINVFFQQTMNIQHFGSSFEMKILSTVGWRRENDSAFSDHSRQFRSAHSARERNPQAHTICAISKQQRDLD